MIHLRDVLVGVWATTLMGAITALFTIVGIMFTPTPGTINQGDAIGVRHDGARGEGECTTTYITGGYLYTAGHCTQVGDTITRQRRLGLTSPIGTTILSAHDDVWDYAVVKLNPGVTGSNTYATNPQPLSVVEPGDMVCHHARQTNTITCEHAQLTGDSYLWLPGTHTIKPGDSGGPVWVPGKGLIGAVTHTGAGWRVSAGGWIDRTHNPPT